MRRLVVPDQGLARIMKQQFEGLWQAGKSLEQLGYQIPEEAVTYG